MKDPVEQSNQIVAAYNAKDFARMRTLVHPSMDFSHVNRGFSFNKSEDLFGVLEMFAAQLMPDRRMSEPERVIAHQDTVVRVARWGGTAQADIPGFGSAGDKVELTLCSIMRFDAQGLLVEWKDYG